MQGQRAATVRAFPVVETQAVTAAGRQGHGGSAVRVGFDFVGRGNLHVSHGCATALNCRGRHLESG